MKVRPWQWTPFTNSARGPNDTFILYHWQHKLQPDEPQPEYPFAKFNKVKKKISFHFKKFHSVIFISACRCFNIYR